MSRKTFTLPDHLYEYFVSVSLREPAILRKLRTETGLLPVARMQISPELGQFLGLLVALLSPRNVLEIGVFTGYSSLSVALALPPDGRMIACDVSEEWTSVARRYWKKAGVEDKIELRVGPALETMNTLLAEGKQGHFDFVFIDADKKRYPDYYECALQLLRPGGLIAVDNVLWSGKVADPRVTDRDTRSIRTFNRKLKNDRRVILSMIPIGDGVTLAMKRA
jgi:predicted O-methyltransferase YrrM